LNHNHGIRSPVLCLAGKTFFQLKDRLKELTGEIYETNKKFTQNVGLNSMEHLLEDYGTLLKFARFDVPEPEEGTGGGTGCRNQC